MLVTALYVTSERVARLFSSRRDVDMRRTYVLLGFDVERDDAHAGE